MTPCPRLDLRSRRWRGRLMFDRWSLRRSLRSGWPGSISSGAVLLGHTAAHFQRDIVVDRARMRFLVWYAEIAQQIDDYIRLDLKLAGQLIDADFTHTVTPQAQKDAQGFLHAPDLTFTRTFRALYPNRFTFVLRFLSRFPSSDFRLRSLRCYCRRRLAASCPSDI